MNSRSSSAGWLLATAAASTVAFGVAWLVFVGTAPGQWIDGELLPRDQWGGGYTHQTTLLRPAAVVVQRFGNPVLLGLALAALLAVGALTRRIWAAVAAVAVFACSVGAAGLVKQVLSRPELGVAGSSTHNSFPSGHVAAAAALLLGVLLVAPPRLRWCLAVPGTAGVSIIGAGTMVLGWHRFSDVVGSLLLVGAIFCVAAAALTRVPDRTAGTKNAQADNDAVTGLLSQGVALTLLIMLVLALAPDAGLRLMAVTAAVGVLTMLVVSGAVWLIRPIAKEPATLVGAAQTTRHGEAAHTWGGFRG